MSNQVNRREELEQNLRSVQQRITRSDVTLIVVTKTYPVSDVQILKELGVENFGENRNEEGDVKSVLVPAIWHYQGEIQSRKLPLIAQWANVIHSLDELSHAKKLSSVLTKDLDVFIQLSLDGDPDRGGVSRENLPHLAQEISALAGINILGLMCVLPLGVEAKVGFAEVAEIHRGFQRDFPNATKLSAGMSGDFEIAIDFGATHIRVGSQILGPRSAHG
ncbi:MAG: YggS family pyridoxal phosphate-dependent enzyme [Actinobacteria bacterium]|nr:YggS family pyridoxal phosphate-dependent enzyme [Actinomycetota bacterium]